MIKVVDEEGWTTLVRKPRKPKTSKPATATSTVVTTTGQSNRGAKSNRNGVKTAQPKVQITVTDLHKDPNPVKVVGKEIGLIIQKARASKQLSQKDLATKINEKPTVITDYENGVAPYSNSIIGRLEQVLEVKLRGKDIGVRLVKK